MLSLFVMVWSKIKHATCFATRCTNWRVDVECCVGCGMINNMRAAAWTYRHFTGLPEHDFPRHAHNSTHAVHWAPTGHTRVTS